MLGSLEILVEEKMKAEEAFSIETYPLRYREIFKVKVVHLLALAQALKISLSAVVMKVL